MIPEVFFFSCIRTITHRISFNKETKNTRSVLSDDMFPYQRMITHVTGLFYNRISHRQKHISYISTGFSFNKETKNERSETRQICFLSDNDHTKTYTQYIFTYLTSQIFLSTAVDNTVRYLS